MKLKDYVKGTGFLIPIDCEIFEVPLTFAVVTSQVSHCAELEKPQKVH